MRNGLLLAAMALGVLGGGSMCRGAVAYDARSAPATDGVLFGTSPLATQFVSMPTVPYGYLLTSMTVTLRWTNAVTTSDRWMGWRLYQTLDPSSTATTVDSGVFLGGLVQFDPSPVGTHSFTFNLGNSKDAGSDVGLELQFFQGNNSATFVPTADIVPVFNTGTASVGSNDGYIYQDDNHDGTLSGNERQQLTGTSGQPAPTELMFSISATPAPAPDVPEPATGGIATVAAMICLARRRR